MTTKDIRNRARSSPPQPNRSIVMTSVAALKPYTRNARTHSDRQIEQIVASMRMTGFVGSILAEPDGTIIAGHGRLEAAKRLGMDEVPVTTLDHLNEAEIRAFRIADNRIAEKAGWSEDLLRLEFADLSMMECSFDLSVTGFDQAEIDMVVDSVGNTASTDPVDDVPAVADKAVSKTGDIWLLGKHRLMCGSMLERDACAMLVVDTKVAMVFTDPPYNVAVAGHVCGLGNVQHREFAMASGEMSEPEFEAFLQNSLRCHADATRDGGVIFVCMDWRHIDVLLKVGRQLDLSLLNLCVWNKTNGGMGSLYRSKHELVAVFKKGRAPHINNVQLGRFGRYRTNVWDYAGANSFGHGRGDLDLHPTVKPIALVADAIRDVSRRGDIVLDGFMGSGTTLLAAERSGRVAYGMEIDPLYVDLAIRRWQALTHKAAVHAVSGERFDALALAIQSGEGD